MEIAPAHEQVRDYLGSLILSGEFSAGFRLPSTQELARQLGTHTATAHRAMTELVEQGLLVRRVGYGTFVRGRSTKLSTVGIYCLQGPALLPESGGQRLVYAELLGLLQERELRVIRWMDERPMNRQTVPLPAMEEAIRTGQFDALVVPCVDMPHLSWLQKLSCPTAFGGHGSLPNSVLYDSSQMIEMGLDALVAQGCRSVGFVSPLNPGARLPVDHSGVNYFTFFRQQASRRGLETNDDWIQQGCIRAEIQDPTTESFGYRVVRKMWSSRQRPEGLFVFPDTVARGALLALSQLGVEVGRDVKLVAQQWVEAPIFCPLPATFLNLSAKAFAEALIAQVETQFAGGTCTHRSIPFTLETPTQKEK